MVYLQQYVKLTLSPMDESGEFANVLGFAMLALLLKLALRCLKIGST